MDACGQVGAINRTIDETGCLHPSRIPKSTPPLVSWFRAPGPFPPYAFQLLIRFFQSHVEEGFRWCPGARVLPHCLGEWDGTAAARQAFGVSMTDPPKGHSSALLSW